MGRNGFKVLITLTAFGIFLASPGVHPNAEEGSSMKSEESTGQAVDYGDLELRITGLRNDDGQVLAALFSSPQGFPDHIDKAAKVVTGPIAGGKAIIRLKQIQYGTYALGVLHDEDSDGDLKTNFIGMPLEGYGTSNNVKSFWGPPSFEKTKFQVQGDVTVLEIRMNY